MIGNELMKMKWLCTWFDDEFMIGGDSKVYVKEVYYGADFRDCPF